MFPNPFNEQHPGSALPNGRLDLSTGWSLPITLTMNKLFTSLAPGTRPVLPAAWILTSPCLPTPISHQVLLIQPSNYLPHLLSTPTPASPLRQGPFSPEVLLRRTWEGLLRK